MLLVGSGGSKLLEWLESSCCKYCNSLEFAVFLLIVSAHLVDSTRSLKTVYLPFIAFGNEHLDGDRLAISLRERQDAGLFQIGTGFRPRDTQLYKAIQNICDYTIIVENYLQGGIYPRASITLVDQRNYTQYSLISSPATDPDDDGYVAVRLACIVYSLLVIFPLPPIAATYQRLSNRLQRSILQRRGPQEPTLQLWILVMGALISIGTADRQWFVEQLIPLVQELSITAHASFVAVLSEFLWHPKTNAVDGLELWTELASRL
jgi:hypothetical protein